MNINFLNLFDLITILYPYVLIVDLFSIVIANDLSINLFITTINHLFS